MYEGGCAHRSIRFARERRTSQVEGPVVPCFGAGGDELEEIVEPSKEKGNFFFLLRSRTSGEALSVIEV